MAGHALHTGWGVGGEVSREASPNDLHSPNSSHSWGVGEAFQEASYRGSVVIGRPLERPLQASYKGSVSHRDASPGLVQVQCEPLGECKSLGDCKVIVKGLVHAFRVGSTKGLSFCTCGHTYVLPHTIHPDTWAQMIDAQTLPHKHCLT